MPTLSVVISAYNEEDKIRRCLESVKFADEVIYIDNCSTDKSVFIAKEYPIKYYQQKNNPMLNVNKNFGFLKAKSDWILSIDADEEIPKELAFEIRNAIKHKSDTNGFWIPRKNIIFGKWIKHGLWWPDLQLRLFQRDKGAFPCNHVHEYLAVDGRTETLNHPLIHHNYESVSQYIRKMDTLYTESEVIKLWGNSYQFSWSDAIKFPISDFIKIYFAQEGYKDGLHGLVLAMLQAFYSFIVFAKLWEKGQFTDIHLDLNTIESEIIQSQRNIQYWLITSRIQESNHNNITKLLLKIKRRFFSKP